MALRTRIAVTFLLLLAAVLAAALGANTASASRSHGKIIVNSGESLKCPEGGPACVVTVQAIGRNSHNRMVGLGQSTITIAPATTTKLIFTLDDPGKRMLTRGPLRADLTVTIRHGSDAPILSSHAITIGVPQRRHSHKR